MKTTFFERKERKAGSDITLAHVAKIIQHGRDGLAEKTWRCIELVDDKDAYTKYKASELPVITLSGTWKDGGKTAENIAEHNGLVSLDIDGLENTEDVEKAKDYVNAQPATVLSFVSPSGRGVKGLIRVDPIPSTPDEHKIAWHAMVDAYPEYEIDPSSKNINRLCFLAHDPKVYFNPDAAAVTWTAKQEKKQSTAQTARYSDADPSRAEVEEWLSYADAGCDRNTWLGVGTTLKLAGYPVALWKSWSRTGHNFVEGECENAYPSLNGTDKAWGQLVNLAKAGGYMPTPKTPPKPNETPAKPNPKNTSTQNDAYKALPVDETNAVPIFPDSEGELFIGAFNHLYRAYAWSDVWSADMLMAMGIGQVGYIAGRNITVKTSEKARSQYLNQYILAVGDTDYTAKSEAVTESKKIIYQATRDFQSIASVQSIEGLLQDIANDDEISTYVMLDEGDTLFKNAQRQGTRNLLTQIGELWLCPETYKSSWKTGKGAESVEKPYLNCWGNVPTHIVTSVFRQDDLLGGFLNRWLPFYIHGKEEFVADPFAIPEEYHRWVRKLRYIHNIQDDYELVFTDEANDARVDWARELRAKVTESRKAGLNNVGITRFHTHAKKIAGIFALVDNKLNDMNVTLQHWETALSVVEYLSKSYEYLFKGIGATRMGEVENTVLDILNRNGNEVTLSKISHAMQRTDAGERLKAIENLQQEGKIIRFNTKTGGRGRPVQTIRRIG